MKESYYQEKSFYYGIAHTRLRRILDLAGRDGGRQILDVGCARGYIGRRLNADGNQVTGIELSEPAAVQARQVLDQVYVFDIERPWPAELVNPHFDLAILTEVLEHVFNPVEILDAVGKTLRAGGEIIVTTPNFLKWINRIRFLFGFFQYTEQGSLDFGHIRFFTYRYLKEVLAESGFAITAERHIIFPGKLTAILKYWPSLFASQFVVKAQKL